MGRTDLKGKTRKPTVHWSGKDHPWSRKKPEVVEEDEYTEDDFIINGKSDKSIKPCPFCGQLVELEKERSGFNTCGYKYRYQITCPCGMAKTPQDFTKKKVVDIWNRRAA